MITVDMKTVMIANIIINTVCLIVILVLWYHNRHRYSGLVYWVIDWLLQVGGALLITLRGTVPIWASAVLSNSMIVGGTIILFFGLCRFAGKKITPIPVYLISLVFAIFVFVHSYFSFIQDILIIRNYNLSIGLSLACLMNMWLIFKGMKPEMRNISSGLGISFAAIILINLVRIVGFSLLPQTSNDFLQSGTFDTLLVLLFTGAIVFLVFNLILIVNRRLYLESQQAEKTLRGTEDRNRSLFENMLNGYAFCKILVDAENKPVDFIYLDVNEAFERLTLLKKEDVIGKRVTEAIPTIRELNPEIIATYGEVALTGKPTVFETYFKPLGSWLNVSAYSPQKGYFVAVFDDITERKQAEEKLKASEERFRQVSESAGEMIWEVDTNGLYTYCSAAVEKILGYTADELIGKKHFYDLFAPDQREGLRKAALAAFQTKLPFHNFVNPNIHKNGGIIILETSGVAVFDKSGIFQGYRGADNDITESRQGEGKLRESEEFKQLLMENTPNAILVQNPDTSIQYVNPAFEKLTAYSESEIIGKKAPYPYWPPEKVNQYLGDMQRTFSHGVSFTAPREYIKKTGERIWASLYAGMVYDSTGKFKYRISNYIDITERRRVERELIESEERYRTLFEFAAEGILITDIETKQQKYANPAVCTMLGYSQEELLKLSINDIHPKDSLAYVWNEFSAQSKGEKILASIPFLKKDGTVIYVNINATKAIIDGREVNIGFLTDVTEKIKTEAAIRESLAEKETLLKEVHHRVKNNMQVISSLLRLQAGKITDPDARAILKDSQNRIQSMALVYNKLYQSRNLASIDMTDYIRELTIGLIKSYVTSANRISARIDPGNVSLSVDKAIPCGLVINELVTNSLKYAFPENRAGQITVSLKKTDNRKLELVVSDNGVGIPAGFDLAKTSTLGLKLVTNLVQDQLGGKIELDTTQGTSFKITFLEAKEDK